MHVGASYCETIANPEYLQVDIHTSSRAVADCIVLLQKVSAGTDSYWPEHLSGIPGRTQQK